MEQAADSRSPLKRLPFGIRGLSMPVPEALHRRSRRHKLLHRAWYGACSIATTLPPTSSDRP
ncbi:hypothetical protein CFN79_17690 [Chromobacterium vaccinii]|nr:hypothetical protein CFN79_17690 [Chromobacterium vaccinii]